MRLICGFLTLDGAPAEAAKLDAMVAAMTEPGLHPAVARLVEGPAALAVLDFAASVAPSPAGLPRGESGLALAADLRLDEPAAAGTDPAATLLTLLERQGVAGLPGLSGDFAAVAWDSRTRSLLCLRDGMGVRPLFLHHRPGRRFTFASLPRGLHATDAVPRLLDEGVLLDRLLGRQAPPARSLFRQVERLEPGGWLHLTLGAPGQAERIARGRHWRLEPGSAGRASLTPEDAAAHLAALVAEAVRRRLPAAGPVAAHLSGGLDSSAISVLAARALRPQGRPLLAYSFAAPPCGAYAPPGEIAPITAVLDQEPDIVWTEVGHATPLSLVLPEMDQDQVFARRDVPDAAVFADAARRGAGLLLSGWGGDEGATFAGRGALAELALSGRWPTLAAEIKALAAVMELPPAMVARGHLLPYLLPQGVLDLARRLRGGGARPQLGALAALYTPLGRRSLSAPPLQLTADGRKNRFRLLTAPIIAHRCEEWALLGALYGMATAFPLLDRQVVSFALSLPSSLFLRQGWPRRLFRDAMAGVLPDAVRLNPRKSPGALAMPALIATQRDAMRAAVAAFRTHPGVSALFDLDAVAGMVAALPDPDTVHARAELLCADPAFSLNALWLRRLMAGAAYVHQHH